MKQVDYEWGTKINKKKEPKHKNEDQRNKQRDYLKEAKIKEIRKQHRKREETELHGLGLSPSILMSTSVAILLLVSCFIVFTVITGAITDALDNEGSNATTESIEEIFDGFLGSSNILFPIMFVAFTLFLIMSITRFRF